MDLPNNYYKKNAFAAQITEEISSMKRLKVFVSLMTLLILLAIASPDCFALSAQKSGCCSWHGGIAYCGSNGYYICNDGTQSPSCT